MRVTTDEVANIDCLGCIVVESQADTKIACKKPKKAQKEADLEKN